MIQLLLAVWLAQDTAPVKIRLDEDARHQFRSDLDKGGSSSLSQARQTFDLLWQPREKDRLYFTTTAERTHYDFSQAPSLQVNALSAELGYFHLIDEHWTTYASLSVGHSWEDGADLGDALWIGTGGGVLYRVSPELRFGLQVRVQSRIEDDLAVYPLFYFEWKPTDEFTLRTESRSGYGVAAEFALADKGVWSLESRTYYTWRRYRLDDDDGILQDERLAADLGLRWRPSAGVTAAVYVGADLRQKFRVEDRDGERIATLKGDPAPFVALSLTLRW